MKPDRDKRQIWRNRAVFGVLVASLACHNVLQAEDVKQISTDEAMSAVISKAPLQVTEIAKQLRLSGVVEVQLEINEDGSVDNVTTISGNPVLARSVIDSMKKWKFKPFKSKVSTKFKAHFGGDER